MGVINDNFETLSMWDHKSTFLYLFSKPETFLALQKKSIVQGGIVKIFKMTRPKKFG